MSHHLKSLFIVIGTLSALPVYAEPTTNTVAPQPLITTAQAPAAAQTPATSALTAKLAMSEKDQRIYATIELKQADNNPGNILVEWTPPLHSQCSKSSYSLSYQGKLYHTNSYRTWARAKTNGESIACKGEWSASVKDSQGIELAKATFQVDENKTAPQQAASSTANADTATGVKV
jgi:hypothetical protein